VVVWSASHALLMDPTLGCTFLPLLDFTGGCTSAIYRQLLPVAWGAPQAQCPPCPPPNTPNALPWALVFSMPSRPALAVALLAGQPGEEDREELVSRMGWWCVMI